MPTYEYACRDCGEHLEVVQSFRDEPLSTCGFCEGDLRKVFSAAGIIFKGSGYYVTDTRREADAGTSDSTSSGSTGKDDSKKSSTSSTSSEAGPKAESA